MVNNKNKILYIDKELLKMIVLFDVLSVEYKKFIF